MIWCDDFKNILSLKLVLMIISLYESFVNRVQYKLQKSHFYSNQETAIMIIQFVLYRLIIEFK